MRAAVTLGPRNIQIQERPDPTEQAGTVVLRPELVGICGSDLHFYRAEFGPSHSDLYPVVQGHEFSAVVEAVDASRPDLELGERVIVWPVSACGHCRTCQRGRPNVCQNLALIGVHTDGALQDYVRVRTSNVMKVGDLTAQQAALVEPASVAVHTVERAGAKPGESMLVFGAGPVGFATAICAASKGVTVTIVDPDSARLDLVSRYGFAVINSSELTEGTNDRPPPDVVVDTSGHPAVLQTSIDVVAHGGRIAVVGMTGNSAPVCSGLLPVKELDIVGVSCCISNEFAAAVPLVRANAAAFDAFLTRTVAFDQVADAFEPAGDFKTMIDLRGTIS